MSVNLIYYASKGNLEKIKQCIQNGVFVDAHGGKGETALYQASKNGFRKCVRYLLKRGADPNRLGIGKTFPEPGSPKLLIKD